MRTNTDHGFTLVELLVVVGIVGLLAGIAAPSLLRARISANEAAAITTLRAVSSAQISFAVACGMGFYADSFSSLALTGPDGSAFLQEDLADDPSSRSGYVFAVESVDGPAVASCNGAGLARTYAVTAEPTHPGTTGTRHFFTNNGLIWADVERIAPVQSGDPASGQPLQ
jgi:prepilin-type N-terminal cleavage/methylation domain-containing protein